MRKQVFYLKDVELAFGNILHELASNEFPDPYLPIIWVYRWNNKTAYSEAFRQLVAYNLWEN